MADGINSEKWISVLGYEGLYEVSDSGMVMAVRRHDSQNVSRGGLLKLSVCTKIPYLKVTLFLNGRRNQRYVHRLVYGSFIAPIPDGFVICHNDGNPQNNNLSNLRLDTQSGNLSDRERHGTNITGERNGRSKLTEELVREIHQRHMKGETIMSIARDSTVHRTVVNKIVLGQHWNHIFRELRT